MWLLVVGAALLIAAVVAGAWLWRRRSQGRAQGVAWSRQDKTAVAGAAVSAGLGAATLALGVISFVVQARTGEAAAERASSSDLEIASVSVLDSTQDRDAPTLDLKLRNVGGQVSVLTGVTITVRSSGALHPCWTRDPGWWDYLSASAAYPVSLPAGAPRGTTITAPVSQKMAPNSADDFQVTVGLRRGDDDWGGVDGTYWAYAVDLGVLHDGASAPVSAGSAVLFVPESHNYAGAADYSNFVADSDSDCYQNNRTVLKQMQAARGAKPPSLLNTP
jgi:hypothetical protein